MFCILPKNYSKLWMTWLKLVHWSRKWGMVLNVGKSKIMLFGESNDVIQLQMYDNKIEQVSKMKYLGVWLDQQLNFSLQVDLQSPKLRDQQRWS